MVGSRAQRRPGAAALIENGALVVAASVGLAAITVAVDVWDSARGWLLAGNAKGIATVAQVVPATVVAVFVFALGAVFVVAQILIPSRGARSISVLLRYVRTRLVLAAGVVLLVGSLLIVPGGPPEHLEHWRAELAAALLVAAGLYIVAATLFLAWTLQGQISPRTFKDRLVKKPRPWGLAPRRSESWDSENLFWTLRVFRGWIRTVSRIGESRDLHFALDGLLKLVEHYVQQVRREQAASAPPHRPLRTTAPNDYAEAKASKIGAVPDALFGAATGKRPVLTSRCQQCAQQALADLDDYWFANELGRALTRAAESGVRGNTLRRDLDRLLNLFDRSILAMAPRTQRSNDAVLVPETRTMVKQLIEVGLGVRQSDEAQRDWYAAPARRLARLVGHLCEVVRERAARGECTPDWDTPCSLPQWTLAGWLMVTAAYLEQQPTSSGTGKDSMPVTAIVGDASQWFGRLEHADWEGATELARSGLLEPSWDVIVDEGARVERICCLAARAEKMVSSKRWWRRAGARLAQFTLVLT